MRRSYISPEFIYSKVNGTLNMSEQSSFFGSKMIDIDDYIQIKNENIIYYQLSSNEQIDIISENSLPQKVYDTVLDKKLSHALIIDESQSESQKNNNTKWILNIQLRSVLRNYLFSTLKKYRTFEGVKNNMTKYNDVNSSITEYIDLNILNRYKFKSIDMYVSYVDLLMLNGLKYNNQYDANIENVNNIFKKIQTETEQDEKSMKIYFTQEKNSSLYAFKYYYNLYYEKI